MAIAKKINSSRAKNAKTKVVQREPREKNRASAFQYHYFKIDIEKILTQAKDAH